MLKQTEKNNTSHFYQQFLMDMPVGIIILNTDGIIQFNNVLAERFVGAQLVGRSWLEVLQTEIKKISHQGHYVILRNDIKVMITTQSSDILNSQMLLLTDISCIKQESDSHNTRYNLQAINKLSSTLAHQLRTPLSTALVYMSSLKSKFVDEEKVLKPINKSIEQLNIIKYLIENELAIFKSKDIKVEPVVLRDLLANIIENYSNLYPKIKFNFNTASEDKKLTIYGHRKALTSAINNIVDNAIEASHYQGTIDVNTLSLDGKAYINIIDYGEGINQFNFNKVSQTFFTTKKKGSGLGVPIAQSIFEAHQGTLNFTSNKEYTTFTICIPAIRNNHE